jgi:hypothetical protein
MGILLVDISSFIMMEGKPHAMSNHLAKVTRQAEHVDRIQLTWASWTCSSE